MFEEFGRGSHKQANRRFGVSLAASSLLYLGLFGSAVAASAAVRKAVVEEDLTQVEFALPDEPPPPPVEAPPPPPPKPKPKVSEPKLPDAIPDEKLEESDGPLADAPAAGPVDAPPAEPEPAPVVEEAPPAPKAPAGPIQVPEDATPASALPGNTPVEYPEEARKNGVQGEVIVKLVINAAGEVVEVNILRGPEIFAEAVKKALLTWKFEPARLPDGTAFASFKIIRLPFKLENM